MVCVGLAAATLCATPLTHIFNATTRGLPGRSWPPKATEMPTGWGRPGGRGPGERGDTGAAWLAWGFGVVWLVGGIPGPRPPRRSRSSHRQEPPSIPCTPRNVSPPPSTEVTSSSSEGSAETATSVARAYAGGAQVARAARKAEAGRSEVGGGEGGGMREAD